MKVRKIYLLVLLLSLASYAAYANNGGTITFTGQIVNSQPTSQTTVVTPETDAQTGQTTYVVTSKSTGRQLASFDSLSAANQFVAQLNPMVPLEQ